MCINCDDNSTDIPVGLTGDTGAGGTFGGFCGEWKWSTSTSSGPASTEVRFNNATYASVTSIYVSDTNRDSVNYDAFLDSFSNAGYFGYIRIFKEYDSSKFWLGQITAVTDNGTDHSIDVTYILSNGAFAANDSLIICFVGSAPPPQTKERINTVFRESDLPYLNNTSLTLKEAGTLVYNQTEMGNILRARVVVKSEVITQTARVRVTDRLGVVLWNTTWSTASTSKELKDLGAVLTTPTTGLNYLVVEFASDGLNDLFLYSIDFYNA